MSKVPVIDVQGKSAGEMQVPDALLAAEGGKQAVHEAVVHYLARRRAGTASTRNKSEVAGTGSKPWRQKGTGRARAGYRQSPVWRGGGVAFGPRPRSYGGKINRKVARLAFRHAFGDRVAAGQVRVVESIEVPSGKTRDFKSMLAGWEVSGPCLVVVDRPDETLRRAAHNVAGVELTSAESVNVYQVVRYATIIVTRAGMEALAGRFAEGGAKGEAAA